MLDEFCRVRGSKVSPFALRLSLESFLVLKGDGAGEVGDAENADFSPLSSWKLLARGVTIVSWSSGNTGRAKVFRLVLPSGDSAF